MTDQQNTSGFNDPVEMLSARFVSAIRAACPEVASDEHIDPLISPSRQPKLGDFQCNAAMSLAKRLGMKPRDIASAIIAKLDAGDLIEPVKEMFRGSMRISPEWAAEFRGFWNLDEAFTL